LGIFKVNVKFIDVCGTERGRQTNGTHFFNSMRVNHD